MIAAALLLLAADPARCAIPAQLNGESYMAMQDRLRVDLDAALAAHDGNAAEADASLDAVVSCYQPAFDAFATQFPGAPIKQMPDILRSSVEQNGSLASPAPGR